jgi:hypothetical protein
LKGIDQSSKVKAMMTKALKKKRKNFKKTLIKMEKRASMEHQNPTLWVVVKRKVRDGKSIINNY